MRVQWTAVLAFIALAAAQAPALGSSMNASELSLTKRCFADAVSTNWHTVYDDCFAASQIAYKHSLTTSSETERQKYLNNEAVADLYVASAASALKTGDAQAAFHRALQLLTYLDNHGVDEQMRSNARGLEECFLVDAPAHMACKTKPRIWEP
jgi:hypothetical protein